MVAVAIVSGAVLWSSGPSSYARHGGSGNSSASAPAPGHARAGAASAYGGNGMRGYYGPRVYTGHIYTGRSTGNFSTRRTTGQSVHASTLSASHARRTQLNQSQSTAHDTASKPVRHRPATASAANVTEPGKSAAPADGGITSLRQSRTLQGKLARNNPANRDRFDQATQNRLKNWNGHRSDLAEARQNNQAFRRGHHDRDWWHHHCHTIILVDLGWWGWWDGWWYPAWGYNPYFSAYGYDGPIYGYDGLAPDEAVANVQSQLQRLGYYSYSVDGVLGPATQQAIMRYQQDHGLPVTGTIDPATVGALGLV
jgi:murein L,D-transpeptidase YcbB/YkuD